MICVESYHVLASRTWYRKEEGSDDRLLQLLILLIETDSQKFSPSVRREVDKCIYLFVKVTKYIQDYVSNRMRESSSRTLISLLMAPAFFQPVPKSSFSLGVSQG